MKKIYTLLLIFTLTFYLTSCGGSEVQANEGEIVFEFPSEYLEYLPYEDVPNFVFKFDGNLNTVVNASLSNRKFFSKNDDFIFSEIISEMLNEYLAKERLTVRLFSKEEQFETRMNILVSDKNGKLKHESQIMTVENGEIFNEIAYLNLETGLTLTIEYRRFISAFEGELKTYYAWRYASPLNMVLHYPVMLHKNQNGEKEFLIVPMPTKVVYHLGVSSQLPLNKLLEKDDYFKENFRRFNYPDYSIDPSEQESFDLADNIKQVKDYYIRDFDGKEEDGEFTFSYKGYHFKITFDDESFLIDIL